MTGNTGTFEYELAARIVVSAPSLWEAGAGGAGIAGKLGEVTGRTLRI
jgi:hypothetical protein